MLAEWLINLLEFQIGYGSELISIDVLDDDIVNVTMVKDGEPYIRSFVFDGVCFNEDEETVWTLETSD